MGSLRLEASFENQQRRGEVVAVVVGSAGTAPLVRSGRKMRMAGSSSLWRYRDWTWSAMQGGDHWTGKIHSYCSGRAAEAAVADCSIAGNCRLVLGRRDELQICPQRIVPRIAADCTKLVGIGQRGRMSEVDGMDSLHCDWPRGERSREGTFGG